MTKGEQIAYAIKKEVCRFSFIEWISEWEISREDWEKFIVAGIVAVDKAEEEE